MSDLDGRVAIITGAARGQGEAEARLLAAHGARVVLTDVLTEQGAAVAADIGAIFPGVIDTPINDANPPGMNEVLVKTTPMRRMGEPAEIAEAVLFLASARASFVTGADFAIDGGMSI